MGERYRSSAPPDFTAFAAQSGDWPTLQRALRQYRQDFKFDRLITRADREEEDKHVLDDLEWLRFSGPNILLIEPAPDYALGEIGHQTVNSLIDAKQLHLESVKSELDPAVDQAMRCLITWLNKIKAFYDTKPREPLKIEDGFDLF